MVFQDRQDAGQKLANKLESYKGKKDIILLGLPRGGVVVAAEISKALELPLDIVVSRKIGAPGNPEFAIGAIDEEGNGVFDEGILHSYGIPEEYVNKTVEEEKKEAARRLKVYRGKKPPLDLHNKIVILVDDGIATGATMRAAIHSAKSKGAKKVVVAVPVTAPDSLKKIQEEADEVVYLDAPFFFNAVGAFYENFTQTEDEEVIEIMKKF